jgi:hypothetical protein
MLAVPAAVDVLRGLRFRLIHTGHDEGFTTTLFAYDAVHK